MSDFKKALSRCRKVLGELSLLNFLYLTIAGIINAFGVTIFLFPVKLYDSGISGLSMLLDQLTPPWADLIFVPYHFQHTHFYFSGSDVRVLLLPSIRSLQWAYTH